MKPVAYKHDGVKLEGFLAYDDAIAPAGPQPGVLVVPEWWGLNDYIRGRARQVAELGYVAFAVDMYGAGVVTDDPRRARELAGSLRDRLLMAERTWAGLDALLATGLVDPLRVAAIGYCFGGTAAQALAFRAAPVAGVVSFHGNLITPSPTEAEATTARFLICHGSADPLVSLPDITDFIAALETSKVDYQFISYAGALHAFTNPASDAVAGKHGMPVGYHASADRRSWQHMHLFLEELFDRPAGGR